MLDKKNAGAGNTAPSIPFIECWNAALPSSWSCVPYTETLNLCAKMCRKYMARPICAGNIYMPKCAGNIITMRFAGKNKTDRSVERMLGAERLVKRRPCPASPTLSLSLAIVPSLLSLSPSLPLFLHLCSFSLAPSLTPSASLSRSSLSLSPSLTHRPLGGTNVGRGAPCQAPPLPARFLPPPAAWSGVEGSKQHPVRLRACVSNATGRTLHGRCPVTEQPSQLDQMVTFSTTLAVGPTGNS